MSGDRAALISLLKQRSVKTGDFTLASGAHSSWYIDCRLTTMSGAGSRLIGPLGWHAILAAGWRPEVIGGLTMGADPIAYAIAAASVGTELPLDAFSVRKEAKLHGTGRRIEGNFAAGAKVVIIEDVITSGGSALSAIRAVRDEGGEVLGLLALVDRGAGGTQRIEAANVAVRSLVTAQELIGPVPAA